MARTEWESGTDPARMLAFLRGRAGDRKLRLFAAACSRRVAHLLSDGRSREAVGVAEAAADGLATGGEWAAAERDARVALRAARNNTRYGAAGAVVAALSTGDAARLAGDAADAAGAAVEPSGRRARAAERAAQADLLRDIAGDPFRPVTADPSWLTSTVAALARGIYEERAFEHMPILADALQDAGCDNADVLDHCRGGGPHVRGCWVVDLILGKDLMAGSTVPRRSAG